MGIKMCEEIRVEYFWRLRAAAWLAAAPAVILVDGRWDAASESGTVASQAKHFSLAHGIREAPSGLRDVPASSPTGLYLYIEILVSVCALHVYCFSSCIM